MKRNLLIALALVAVLFLAGFTLQITRVKWEYKMEYNVNEKKLNQLGEDGWELAGMGAEGSGPTANVITYVFKRQK
jgi:hypothetical protein